MFINDMKLLIIITFFSILSNNYLHSQVTQEWLQNYNSLGTRNDRPSSILYDTLNNAFYVAGFAEFETPYEEAKGILLKYSLDGNLIWARTYDENTQYTNLHYLDITKDIYGNIYLCGYLDSLLSGKNIVTVKYDSAGNFIWKTVYKGLSGGIDYANAIDVDSFGNVYITGCISDSVMTGSDMITLKYNSSGQLQWVRNYYGSDTNILDVGTDLKIDPYGNIYVVGYSFSNKKIVTIKYDPDGNVIWLRNPLNYDSNVKQSYKVKINFDNAGNILVAGATAYHFLIIKYTPQGFESWISEYYYNGAYPSPLDLCVDVSDNIYVSGVNNVGPIGNMIIYKLDSTGQQQWSEFYGGLAHWFANGNSILCDIDGNVYISGFSREQQIGSEQEDYVTLKYSSDGQLLWKKLFNGFGNRSDVVKGMIIDGNNNIYITGESKVPPHPNPNYNIITIKYSQSTITNINANFSVTNFSLSQNYPNPFNPSTNINFEIPKASHVRLVIYDALGREVSILVNERMNAGSYSASFDGANLNSGIYFYTFITDGFKETKKMILLK